MAIYLSKFGICNESMYGWDEFVKAFKDQNMEVIESFLPDQIRTQEEDVKIVAGPAYDLRIKDILEANHLSHILNEDESLLCYWCNIRNGKVLLLSGKDHIGVMYILLEMARKIKLYGLDALKKAVDYSESPDNKVRCMDRYLLGHLDNEWFLNDEFWDYYLKKLAYARFNRFCLIVGFDTAYMAPPYPFFLPPLKKYPQVKVLKMTERNVEKNLKQLKRIGKKCHKYGLKFVFATWQQRPWTAEQDKMVDGLPEQEKDLSEYCYEGLKELLRAVPEIDVVQFRVNLESGVGTEISAEAFWNLCIDAVADAGKMIGKKFILDLRAKGLTEDMITHAFNADLQVEVPTKYWCEHAALPYHITAMRSEEIAQMDNYNHSRRYSYADMLQKPKRYSVIFRLWNYGSTNLFLWGDADYARRFAKSCSIGDSSGYQVNAPLSLKYGHELSHNARWHIFKEKSMRYGIWEEDRFWNWYTVFGRLGYNTNADPEIWQSEFVVHFGKAADAAEKALATASKIIPLITTVHMPVHPSLVYWPEMNTGWAIFEENNIEKSEMFDYYTHLTYGSTEPSDHQLFYGINEYVHDRNQKKLKGKYTPFQYSAWLDELSDRTEKYLNETTAYSEADEAELLSFKVDLEMLVDLGHYHAAKTLAALYLETEKVEKKMEYIKAAFSYMQAAADSWHKLSERGKKYYYDDLNFSSAGSCSRRGTWKLLEREILDDLQTLNNMAKESPETVKKQSGTMPEAFEAEFPTSICAGKALLVRIKINLNPCEVLRLHYRHLNQTEGMFHETVFEKINGGYEVEIPAQYITGEFDLMVYISRTSERDGCRIFPGIYHTKYPYPYHIIKVKGENK